MTTTTSRIPFDFPLLRLRRAPSPSSGTCSPAFRAMPLAWHWRWARDYRFGFSWASRSCWYQKASVGPRTRISNSGDAPCRGPSGGRSERLQSIASGCIAWRETPAHLPL